MHSLICEWCKYEEVKDGKLSQHQNNLIVQSLTPDSRSKSISSTHLQGSSIAKPCRPLSKNDGHRQ